MAELIKTDEELEAMKAEEPQETADVQEEAALDTDFDIEIVDPSELDQEKPQALIDLETKLAALEAEKNQMSNTQAQQAALQATMESVKQLQQQLAGGIKVNADKPQEVPQFDFEGLKRDFNQNIFKDPAEQVTKFMTPFLQELNSKVDSVNSAAARNSSKSEMLISDESRDFYTRYRDEIEAKVQSMPSSPDVYQKALSEVKMAHFDDIIAEKVAEKLNEQVKTPTKPPLTNVGTQAAPAVRQSKKITPGMQRYLQAMHDKIGWDMKDPDNIERAYQLRKEGRIVD
jgi:hypothetical protein